MPPVTQSVVGGFGVTLEEPVEHDLVAVLIGVGEVQHIGGVGLEPPDLRGVAAARNDREPGRHVGVEAGQVHVVREQRRVPEHREVVEYHVVVGERHVVRQPGSWQRDVDPVHHVAGVVDDAVTQVRGVLAVAEVQQFSGAVVDLRMGGHTPLRGEACVPVLFAESLAGARVGAVQVAALVVAGQRGAAVYNNVRRRRVLHQGAGAPAVVAPGQFDRLTDARPERPTGGVLFAECICADEPVAVERFSVPEADDVQHPVTVERVVVLQRGV